MAGKFKYFRLSCVILLLILVLQSAIAKKKSKDDDRKKLLAEYAAFENQVHETLTSIFSKLEVEETCEAGDPNCDPGAGKLPEGFQPTLMSLLAWVDNLDDILRALIPVVTELASQRSEATVSNPIVSAKLNATATISCESDDKLLSLCTWGQIVNGQRETIVIDDGVIKNGGKTEVDGISYEGEGLAGGKCGLKIQALRVKDIGRWSCALITTAGPVFTGEVLVEPEQAVYFATSGAGIKVYSPLTSEVSTVVSSSESCYGIAYDSIHNKIYWSTLFGYKIYRANMDGSQVEAVWNTTAEDAFLQGLAFDWISANLYVGTRDGKVFVCDTSVSRSFTCHLLLTGRGDVDRGWNYTEPYQWINVLDKL